MNSDSGMLNTVSGKENKVFRLRCPDKIGQSRIKQPEQFSNTSC